MGYGTWDMRHGIWDMGHGTWDMGTWDMGYGTWDMGYGDMGGFGYYKLVRSYFCRIATAFDKTTMTTLEGGGGGGEGVQSQIIKNK